MISSDLEIHYFQKTVYKKVRQLRFRSLFDNYFMFKTSTRLITISLGVVATVVTNNTAFANESHNFKNSVITPVPQNPETPVVLKSAIANFRTQAIKEKQPEENKESDSFSLNTKLQGQVIFGLTSGLTGDISRNAAFGNRTRLELVTELGTGTLTTRLQLDGMGTPNSTVPAGKIDTPEGASSFGVGEPSSQVNLDLLKYELPIGPDTQLTVAANAAGADDFTDSINPYFDGDGGSGSISRFGNRPSIYYLVAGTGAGIRHKFSPTVEGSVGYLANNAANPGSGIFGGSYGAIAQITLTPNENTKLGLTYVNSRDSSPGTGSTNANPSGSNNMFGLQGSFKVNPDLALGGWVGYNKNSDAAGDKDILNWAVTAAFPNLGGAGNLGGLLIGQEPRVIGANGAAPVDTGSSLHLEGFYQVKLSENLSITPGLIYLTAPDHNSANGGALIGTIRTTFNF
jgi:hypothetical protein